MKATYGEVRREEDIVFDPAHGLKLDVYSPEGSKEPAAPAVIWIHGGGFEDKPGCDKRQDYIVALSRAFAQRGLVSIAVDYRVRKNPSADWSGTISDAVADARTAYAWIAANSTRLKIDVNRLFIAGGSAGGVLAAGLCYPRADRQGIKGAIFLWGSPPSHASIGPGDPPALMIHGTADRTVRYSLSETFSRNLTDKGIPNVLHPIPGADHTPVDHMEEIVAAIADFLSGALAPGAAGK